MDEEGAFLEALERSRMRGSTRTGSCSRDADGEVEVVLARADGPT